MPRRSEKFEPRRSEQIVLTLVLEVGSRDKKWLAVIPKPWMVDTRHVNSKTYEIAGEEHLQRRKVMSSIEGSEPCSGNDLTENLEISDGKSLSEDVTKLLLVLSDDEQEQVFVADNALEEEIEEEEMLIVLENENQRPQANIKVEKNNVAESEKKKKKVENEKNDGLLYGKFPEPWFTPLLITKFTKDDYHQTKGKKEDPVNYEVQSLVQYDDYHAYVYYVNWMPSTGCFQKVEEMKKTCPLKVEELNFRKEIYDAIEEQIFQKPPKGKYSMRDLFARPSIYKSFKKDDDMFWKLLDFEYTQNIFSEIYNKSPVFYTCWALARNRSRNFSIPNFKQLHENSISDRARVFLEYSESRKDLGLICQCTGLCFDEAEDCCAHKISDNSFNIRQLKYDAYGILNMDDVILDALHVAVECIESCTCAATCPTRVIQTSRGKHLTVFYEGKQKEWGVRASEPIKRGEFICEYMGKVMMGDEAASSYTIGISNGLVIDAVEEGNVGRFVAHSCDPNVICVEVTTVNMQLPRIGLFAYRDIAIGEELGFSYWGQTVLKKLNVRNRRSLSKKGVPCHCDSEKCFQWLPNLGMTA